MIQNENKYLMSALAELDTISRDYLIFNYLKEREKRIEKFSDQYPDPESGRLLHDSRRLSPLH
jgi:hypothetical protein